MDIKQLKSFCMVVDKRSFSQAAARLGLSQPTVSFQIAAIEEAVGAKLFERNGRETTVTKSG